MRLVNLMTVSDGWLIPKNILKSIICFFTEQFFFLINILYSQLRTTILNLVCSLGMDECLTDAGKRFDEWLGTKAVISPDLRNLVYYYGMATVGNEHKWEQMWDIYKKEQDAQEKAKLMYGLSGIQVPWVLKRCKSNAEFM